MMIYLNQFYFSLFIYLILFFSVHDTPGIVILLNYAYTLFTFINFKRIIL